MYIFNYVTKEVQQVRNEIEARELIEKGDAKALNLSKVEEYEQKAKQVFDKYTSEIEKVKASDNPIFTEDVKRYEINRLENELEKESKSIQQEYEEYRKQSLKEAEIKAVRATIHVSEKDKQTAQQFATRALLNVEASTNKATALKQVAREIELLTDEQKTALQSEIMSLLSHINDDYHVEKSEIIDAVKDIRNDDLMALEVAKQLPVNILDDFNRRQIVKGVFN